jgi:hypothetical protein
LQKGGPSVIKYKKPRAINSVSIAMLLMAGLLAYLLVALWPVYTLSSRAKGVLEDALPVLYRANLLPQNVADGMVAKMKVSIPADIRKAGVTDKKLEVIFSRSKKEVAIEAHFKVTAFFPVIEKHWQFELSPRVVTDAARIEW